MTSPSQQLGRWDPLPIPELARLLAPARFPWWVAGGHALDLFLGHTTRPHDDLDVEVLRRDQHAAQRLLADRGWDLHVAAAGHLRPWRDREWLAAGANSVWCRPAPGTPWRLQLMLAEGDGATWVFRRNPTIVRPLATIGRSTADGVPYLTPAIQLLFKAKRPRPKDDLDFNAVLPALRRTDRAWLAGVLAATHPGHPWLARLRGDPNP